MDFSTRFKALRLKSGYTQAELAAKLGITNRAVGAWESGRSRPRLDKMKELAVLFNVTVADLMGEEAQGVRPRPAEYATLPVLVAADVPLSVLERVNDPDAYLMRVRGDCMNRRFCDGENALLSPRCEPRNGDAVAAEYNGEMILRSYYRGASTLVLSPDSYEDGFTDIVFDDPEGAPVELRGVVKWHQASEVRRY